MGEDDMSVGFVFVILGGLERGDLVKVEFLENI